MQYMVLLVLDDVDHCTPILDAWEAAGVAGITLLESTGLGRMRASGIRDDLPLLPSIANLLRIREERHRTMFTVVDNEDMVNKLIELTEGITGDLEAPNKGVLFVLPVLRAVGIYRGPK